MSKLLIPEPPLQVLPLLVQAVDLKPAIALQQIHYVTLTSADDDGWVLPSAPVGRQVTSAMRWWQEVPLRGILSLREVERSFAALRDRGLIETESVTTDTGRLIRVRIDYEAVDRLVASLAPQRKGSRQIGRTPSRQNGGTRPADLVGPVPPKWQDPVTKGTAETLVVDQAKPDQQLRDDEENPHTPKGASPVRVVFDEWLRVTARTARTVLDGNRERLIRKALAAFPLEDVLDAVRGWRRIPHNCGQNAGGTVYNDLALLLRNAGKIEYFRDAERSGRPILAGPDAPEKKAGLGFIDQLGGTKAAAA